MSCTHQIEIVPGFVVLQVVDTPGFDGTDENDAEIVLNITAFRETWHVLGVYERTHEIHCYIISGCRNGRLLHDAAALHRISDSGMAGAQRKLFSMFRKHRSDDALEIVVINMWSKVANGEGNTRQMKPDTDSWYFGSALNMGAMIIHYDNAKEFTYSILCVLLNSYPTTIQERNNFVIEQRPRHSDSDPAFHFHAGHGGEAGVPMGWKASAARKSHDNLVRLSNLYDRLLATDDAICIDIYTRLLPLRTSPIGV